jgi:predicted nucleotidyltransferase
VLSIALSACSSNNKEAAIESTVPAKEMADQILTQFEQPQLMELEAGMVQQLYHLDPALLEQYTIRTPLMNVKTNEIAILKVKDAKDVATVEAAVKQRAADVQKQFEIYLPDQYELSKNYKLVTKGNYVLFVISDKADEMVKSFDIFFEQK